METKNTTRKRNRGIEENTMAILDSSGVKEASDIHDDQLAFLEAVRAASLVLETGTAPTSKMYRAIFQILRNNTSPELLIASYQLLNELDKCFPCVHISHPNTSESSSNKSIELNLVEEAWSPFSLGSESAYTDREATDRNSRIPFDSLGFSLLIQDINQKFNEKDCQVSETKSLGNMLLFQYLVNVLEQDFLPRKAIYQATMNWTFLRESFLNMLLGSRRINYKNLMKECLSIISKGSHHNPTFGLHDMGNGDRSSELTHKCDVALATALIELQKGTCMSVQKLMTLTMELDMIKKEANNLGYTSRADGVRTSLVEIILDELTYDKDLFPPFLEVFSEPKWKLEIILQYFWKYLTKTPIRTRRSSSSSEDATFDAVLRCFTNNTSTKSVVKKISTEVAQMLLAHAFQAYMSLQRHGVNADFSSDDITLQICKDFISAFDNLKKTDNQMEIISFGKEALFTASIMLSTRS